MTMAREHGGFGGGSDLANSPASPEPAVAAEAPAPAADARAPPPAAEADAPAPIADAAPTAPDTLPSYPFKDGDPFVMEDPPDILISGAAPAFATSLASTKAGEACARLVCLPSFAETGVCAVLDLETLAVERLCFARLSKPLATVQY